MLHDLALLLPLLFGHVLFLVEHALIRLAVTTTQTIPQGRVLAIIIIESQVVDTVAGGAIDDGVVRHELAIVDQDGPEVDKDEEQNKRHFLQGEKEGKDVVGDGLGEAVEGVEGVGGEGSGHDPLVVRLVKTLVDERVMQPAMDPVDAEIGKHDEEGELEPIIGGKWGVVDQIVEFGPAAHLE